MNLVGSSPSLSLFSVSSTGRVFRTIMEVQGRLTPWSSICDRLEYRVDVPTRPNQRKSSCHPSNWIKLMDLMIRGMGRSLGWDYWGGSVSLRVETSKTS